MRIYKSKEIPLKTKINKLTVIKKVPKPKPGSLAGNWYLCKCDCGKTTILSVYKLLSFHTTSCGCYKKEIKTRLTHGQSNTKLYHCWTSMMRRCYTPSQTMYRHYGGRGISVCKRWHKFQNFMDDMSKTWEEGKELDRINNSKGYSPSNCRWATRIQQNNNTRANHYVTVGKETKSLADWARTNKISVHTIYDRIKKGWDEVEAVTVLPHQKRGML